jgi:hypothetical protein
LTATNISRASPRSAEKIRTVKELLEIAGKKVSKVLPIETARNLPVVTREQNHLNMIILYYKESTIPNEQTMYPPHYFIAIDIVTGKVLRFEPCAPKDFGMDKSANVPEQGFGLDPQMTGDEFWDKTDKFLDLSSAVWEVFDSGCNSLGSREVAVVKEYYGIFKRIAKKPLLPYYHAVAQDFFDWLEKVTK